MILLCLRLNWRAEALISKLCFLAMARICSLVSSPISGLSFRARETVDLETPARRAISAIVRTDFVFIYATDCILQHTKGFVKSFMGIYPTGIFSLCRWENVR